MRTYQAECGCIDVSNSTTPELEMCPLHAAAPELLAALKETWRYLRIVGYAPELGDTVRSAIAKAEGHLTWREF